jgi:hypothetical protein
VSIPLWLKEDKARPASLPGGLLVSWDGLDRLLEVADVDGVVALVHRPGDMPDCGQTRPDPDQPGMVLRA